MPLAPPSRRTATRGRCPGVLDPMETGDGWLLRVRRPGGAVSPGALRTVAGVASRFGSGAIDLTSRANLQIRGVAVEDLDRAAASLIDGGVALGDPRRDAARAIVASPWTGHDPAAVVDATVGVADIEHRLVNELVGALPSKFGVIVDDGGSWSLDEVDADLRVIARAGSGEVTWLLRLRGQPEALGQVSDPVPAVLAAARLCADHGSRMDEVVERVGVASVAAALGTRPPSPTGGSTPSAPRPSPSATGVGSYPHPDPARGNLVAAPFLGRIDATTAEVIAALAARFADDLRVTPRHSLAFCGVLWPHLAELERALAERGLTCDPADPRARVSACVGSRGCASGRADTTVEAARLAGQLPGGSRVHLSACEKGCGAPAGVRHLVADEEGRFAEAGRFTDAGAGA